MAAGRLKQAVACERGLLEDFAARLNQYKGCQNPERLALVLSRLDWLMEATRSTELAMTISELQVRLFQWLTVKQLEHALYQLRNMGELVIEERKGLAAIYHLPESREPPSPAPGTHVPESREPHLVLENLTENSNAETKVPAKKVPQPRVKAKPVLAELKAKLSKKALGVWEEFESAVAAARKGNRGVTESVLAGLLGEFRDSCEKYGFSEGAFIHGLRGCMKATDGVAENERYFRKVANGYHPDIEQNLKQQYNDQPKDSRDNFDWTPDPVIPEKFKQ